MKTYPETPGYKATDTETSQQAAKSMRADAATLRVKCYDVLKASAKTADEVADCLGVSILSVRPRISELKVQSKVAPTKERRKNVSGKSAVVWDVVRNLSQANLL